MSFSCTEPCTDTFCTLSALPLKNPQGVTNLKKAICVVPKRFDHESHSIITGLPVRPVIKWAFGRRCQKVVARGREDTRVWYRETMFSQMVSYEFLLHEPLHGYFLYLVCALPEKPTKRCEPEEGYLRCSK